MCLWASGFVPVQQGSADRYGVYCFGDDNDCDTNLATIVAIILRIMTSINPWNFYIAIDLKAYLWRCVPQVAGETRNGKQLTKWS